MILMAPSLAIIFKYPNRPCMGQGKINSDDLGPINQEQLWLGSGSGSVLLQHYSTEYFSSAKLTAKFKSDRRTSDAASFQGHDTRCIVLGVMYCTECRVQVLGQFPRWRRSSLSVLRYPCSAIRITGCDKSCREVALFSI